MKTAISLGYRSIGQTWPNPSVGCVIVKNQHIVGTGNTAVKGRPHAEKIALDQAKSEALDSTVYVTLEPCVMCAGASYWTRIGRIVVGAKDLKKGFSTNTKNLLHPTTKIEFGLLEKESKKMLQDFFKKKRK